METMKRLDRIEELLTEEIKPIASKSDISPTELKNLGEALDIIKDIQTIKAMKKAEEEETMYSQENRSSYGRGYRGRSYNSYDDMPNMGSRSYDHNGNSTRMMPYGYPYYMYDSDGMSNNSYGNSMENMPTHSQGSYDGRRGRDADNDGRYSEERGNSYRRGRDAMGRYTSRDDYSRQTEKEMMLETLEDMADDARTERERKTIERCIDKLAR